MEPKIPKEMAMKFYQQSGIKSLLEAYVDQWLHFQSKQQKTEDVECEVIPDEIKQIPLNL